MTSWDPAEAAWEVSQTRAKAQLPDCKEGRKRKKGVRGGERALMGCNDLLAGAVAHSMA